MKSSRKTITISVEYADLAKRYADLAGMSLKAAMEYAIREALLPELSAYIENDDDTEAECLSKNANVLLPEGWNFAVCSFLKDGSSSRCETWIGLDLGLDDLVPTYVGIREAQIIRDSLCDLPNLSGGSFVFGGSHIGFPVKARRHGRGILFYRLDPSTGQSTGEKASIATTSVPRICEALDQIISAARIEAANNS